MKTGPIVNIGQVFEPEKKGIKISFQKSIKKKKGYKIVVLLDTIKGNACCSNMNRPGAFCFIERPPEVDEAIEITAVHSHYLLGKLIPCKKI